MLSRSCIGEKMPKKKKELPVFVVVDMPNWKSRILDFMLILLRIQARLG
jgi:hypothetical protein